MTSTALTYSTKRRGGACAMIASMTPEEGELLTLDRARRRRVAFFPYLMFAPAFLLIASVSFVPIGYAIVQSFFRSSTLQLGRFVGPQNYLDFFLTRNGIETLQN